MIGSGREMIAMALFHPFRCAWLKIEASETVVFSIDGCEKNAIGIKRKPRESETEEEKSRR
jgi:hypothetical protein